MFYEIIADGEPNGMGSTDKEMAEAMCQDYSIIYGIKTELKQI